MGDTMFFPETWEEFLKEYEFKDSKELYTNGSMLIPSFRVKQMMEHYAPVHHGRWIFKDDDGAYPWTTKAICSECKEVIAWNRTLALERNQIEFAKEKHYCPNCGAKMDGDSHDQA